MTTEPHRPDHWRLRTWAVAGSSIGSFFLLGGGSVARSGAVQPAVAVATPTATHPTRPPESGAPWPIKLVVTGSFFGLSARAGSLYSFEQPPPGSRPAGDAPLVRIDESSSKVLASSARLPGAVGPVGVEDVIAVAGYRFESRNTERLGPPILELLDATTLAPRAELSLPSAARAIAGGPGELWLALAGELLRVDPRSGNVLRRVEVPHLSPDVLAIDPSGARLADVVERPSSSTTEPPIPILQLRRTSDGALLASAVMPPSVFGYSTLGLSLAGVFASSGVPGGPGSLALFSTSPLRLVALSGTVESPDTPPAGASRALPMFGQWPSVDVSDGVAFVGSDGQLACFEPDGSLGAIVEQSRQPVVTGPVVVDRGDTFGVAAFQAPGPGTGIVELSPPSSCRP